LNKSFFNIHEVAEICIKKLEYLSRKKDVKTLVTVENPEILKFLSQVFADRGRFE
jgi:hypothetical protein